MGCCIGQGPNRKTETVSSLKTEIIKGFKLLTKLGIYFPLLLICKLCLIHSCVCLHKNNFSLSSEKVDTQSSICPCTHLRSIPACSRARPVMSSPRRENILKQTNKQKPER